MGLKKSSTAFAPALAFGQMPVIKHGDAIIAQSRATAQYAADLGINANTMPTSIQRAIDTSVVSVHADLQSAMYGAPEAVTDQKQFLHGKLHGAVTPLLNGVERLYKIQSSTPFLYNSLEAGPSLGDLAVFDFVYSPSPG